MRIRKFQKHDAGQTSKVMRFAFRSFLAEKFTKDDQERFGPSVLAKGSSSRSRFSETVSFVALDDRQIIGYIRITTDRNGLGSLQMVGVAPDYFGKGVGAILMQAAEGFWTKRNNARYRPVFLL